MQQTRESPGEAAAPTRAVLEWALRVVVICSWGISDGVDRRRKWDPGPKDVMPHGENVMFFRRRRGRLAASSPDTYLLRLHNVRPKSCSSIASHPADLQMNMRRPVYTSAMTLDRLARFGERVAARRRELNLRLTHVPDLGGPSATRMTSIEHGKGPEPKPSTLDKLDSVLRWESGSALRVLNGGEPVALSQPQPQSNLQLTEGTFSIPNDEVASILATMRRLDNQLRKANNTIMADPAFHTAYREHSAAVSNIIGRWVTDLLERNAEPGRPLPPLLELSLGAYLDVEPNDETGLIDRDEQLYRRWLAGRIKDPSPDQLARWRSRLLKSRAEP